MKYIDIHSHVYFPDYDADREEVISRAAKADVGIITVGTDLESSRQAIALAETHENMWAIVGLHPVDAGDEGHVIAGNTPAEIFDYEAFKKIAQHPKVVAIGECGLDYFHMPFNAEYQREIFIKHIELANEVKKPLMLHVRNGKGGAENADKTNAYQDALVILKAYAKVPFNFHFFAGSPTDLKDIIAADGNVSFTGVITFVRDYDELVKTVPPDKIMSETDAPFVSPAPYRGKRNEPAYVIEVAKKIAEIRAQNGDDAEMVLTTLVENAKKFFSI
jgi:TatD DNase family protein